MSQSFSLPLSSPILIGGGRHYQPCHESVAVFRALALSGHSFHVGCARGADQAAISYLGFFVPSALRVFAVAQSVQSAPLWVQQAPRGSVVFGAGGSLSVPIVARLMSRSLAALQGCAAAVFFSPGVGSLKVARAALKQGIPVLVCQQGCPVAPVLAVPPVVVSWFGMSFWLYQPAIQSALF